MQEHTKAREAAFREAVPAQEANATRGDTVGSLDDSLAMTPWERILANDDMINFGDSLLAAMEKRNAEPR